MTAKIESTYHHGNVKNDLVATAILLLESEGLEQISLRRLAREIGITPAAVYNHFASKQDLMASIKANAFNEMYAYINLKCTNDSCPEKAFEELCQAYIDFSQEHASLFDVLFGIRMSAGGSGAAAAEAYDHRPDRLAIVVQRLYDMYGINATEERLLRATVLIWGQLHGLIALSNSGAIAIAISRTGWTEHHPIDAYINIGDLTRQFSEGFYRSLKQQQAGMQSSSEA